MNVLNNKWERLKNVRGGRSSGSRRWTKDLEMKSKRNGGFNLPESKSSLNLCSCARNKIQTTPVLVGQRIVIWMFPLASNLATPKFGKSNCYLRCRPSRADARSQPQLPSDHYMIATGLPPKLEAYPFPLFFVTAARGNVCWPLMSGVGQKKQERTPYNFLGFRFHCSSPRASQTLIIIVKSHLASRDRERSKADGLR